MRFTYVCSECAAEYPIDPNPMVCPACSAGQGPAEPVRGILEVRLVGAVASTWEIADLLPVPERFNPPIPVGQTPLWRPARLRGETGFARLFIKDDGLNPTFSYKDRASFLVSAFARQHGIQEIVLASTGNAGSSMAGVGAAAGQDITIFLPETAPEAKLVQALQYGARVFRVRGNYDLAYDFSLEYSRARGSLNRNTGYNPMTIEGKKTASLEVFRELGAAPDHVFVAAGDGCIVSGVLKGFRDLRQLGLIDRLPQVHAVQAATSDALSRALQTGEFQRQTTHTVADSICVDVPRVGFYALRLIREASARIMRVTDQEILAAQHALAAGAGLFAEPAGAAAYAGFLQVAGELDPEETVVILSTGNGLKDVASAQKGVAAPAAPIASVQEALDRG